MTLAFPKSAAILALLLSTACAPVIDALQQSSVQTKVEVGKVPTTWRAANLSGPVLNGWLSAFNDPVLTRLVNEAIAHNHDLKSAALNVKRANAFIIQANASRYPSLDGTFGAGRSDVVGTAGPAGAITAGLQAQWEVDVWGRLSSGRRAALFQRDVAQADLHYSQLSIAGSVAKAYFAALEARQQAWVAQLVRNSLAGLQTVVRAQVDAGLSSNKDISLINSDLAVAEGTLIKTRGQIRTAERGLQVLLGRYPSADLSLRKSFPRIPRQPKAGLPSSLLERRPDLLSAERKVAAAFEGINQAQAARLPAFNLSASAKGSSASLGNVLNSGNLGWSIAGNILTPIFNAGSLKAKVEDATLKQQQAVQAYATAALTAFQEVEQQLDQGRVLSGRHNAVERARGQAREALRLIRISYQAGEVELQDVLQIEQKVFSLNSNYQTLNRERLDQIVDLNVALGGDWGMTVPVVQPVTN